MKQLGDRIRTLDAIVVGLGPGSYAGVRIAIASAIGLKAASGAKLVGLPSICAMEPSPNEYCVIGDARRESFFFARVVANQVTEGIDLCAETELRRRLETISRDVPVFTSEKLPAFPQADARLSIRAQTWKTGWARHGSFFGNAAATDLFARAAYHRYRMTQESCRCWAEIDRNALRQNAAIVRERVGAAELLAVVKANGYGHGMIGVAKALANDAQLFGVANLEEAIALRAVLSHPIMILRAGYAGGTSADCGTVGSFRPSRRSKKRSNSNARRTKKIVSINFVVDTGMGRMGTPEQEALDVFRKVAALRRHQSSQRFDPSAGFE